MSATRKIPIAAATAALLLLGACGTGPAPSGEVHKSLYLGKRWMKFVMDNGPSYRDVKLADGSTIHYWRSDTGKLLAIASGRDDNYPDVCELALRTDPSGIVRSIRIVQDSVLCGGILR